MAQIIDANFASGLIKGIDQAIQNISNTPNPLVAYTNMLDAIRAVRQQIATAAAQPQAVVVASPDPEPSSLQ